MEKVKVKVFNNGENDLPNYSTSLSAGFDFRSDFSKIKTINDLIGNTQFTLTNIGDEKIVTLLPGGRVLIPTNLHIKLPDNYELQVRPRSGLALKNGITIVNSPGTVDPDYTGNVGIILLNTDLHNSFEIRHGDRIAQGVINEVKQVEWDKVDTMEDLGKTDRGQGGFGHTGV
ncbi:MAG: dUTP diphosphatase [Saccharofermentanales bacterium]